jgi:mannose/fructose/N-acetylgalactosamine-specific phosphotransferase system component IIC
MLSQPIAAGPLFGWILGQVKVGVVIGGIMQLLWMEVSPVGVGIPFDVTAVTLLAVFWACLQPDAGLSHMMLSLLIAVPFGYVFCFVDSYARRLNTLAARRLESVPDEYLGLSLNIGIIGGLAWSWLRYFVFFAFLMWGGGEALKWLTPKLPEWFHQGLYYAAVLLPVAGLGVSLELFLTEEPEGRTLPAPKKR